uniref:TF-B3 domain-containing protein n=1 Tax=Oryza punctata TaxID=4537 RepID=A0A0E0MP60_ORYPU
MEKPHALSKNSVAYQYWLYMDDHEKSFIKVIIDDYIKLIEPYFRGEISETVKLETRNGSVYNVQVVKEVNKFVLRSGWAGFASSYEIEWGDILVFIYNGESHFKVLIYDPSGCEKELSCVLMSHSPHVQEKSILQDNHTQSRKNHSVLAAPVKVGKLQREIHFILHDDNQAHHMAVCVAEIIPSSEEIEESANSGSIPRQAKSFFCLAKMRNMTSEQMAEVDALKEEIQPQIPFYITAMHKASVVDGSLAISKDYAVKYQLDKNKTIKLCQHSGSKTWEINLDINTDVPYALSTG